MYRFFINRPIVAMVIAILMVLVGLVSMLTLPISQFPNIVPPEIRIQATFVGADAETLQQSVATPIEEVMRGLDDLVRAGKILYVGVSNAPAWWIARANTLAELTGWTPFIGLQIEYNLIERTPERELLPMAEALGLGIAAWSPLASGLLTGKYAPGSTGEKRLEKWPSLEKMSERNLAIAGAVVEVAKGAGKSPAQVALNWLRPKRGMVPILGARKLSQLEDNLRCLEWSLDAQQVRRLDEASEIELGFPMDFLHRKGLHDALHGGMFERISRC